MQKSVATLLLLSSFLIPGSTHASVVLSEIMHDLEGADSGREWVEFFNGGSQTVSLTDWKFFENGTNHKLTLISGTETISSGGYVVIADNSEKFLSDWPGFSGTLFDSAFSLSNSGETLTIRDSALVEIDSYTYSSETGAAGDGNTLSKQSDGTWVSAAATPGSGSLTTAESTSTVSDPDVEGSTNSSTSSGVSIPVAPQIFADAGEDRILIVGADSVFEADAWGLLGKPLSGARYFWNFGDGSFIEGKKVLHHYDFPGRYVVMLHISSDVYTATDSFIATADPAEITITKADGERVVVENDAGYRVDISGWMIREGSTFFVFPEGTVLLPKTSVSISNAVSGLKGLGSTLLYPNGELVVATTPPKVVTVNARIPTSISSGPNTIVGTVLTENKEVSVSEVPPPKEELERDERENQVAAVKDAGGDGNTLWYVLLALLVGIGAVAAYFVARNEGEFEIIDETEE